MTHIALEMKKPTLIEEIQRYLAVVDAFRAMGAHPSWASEAPVAQPDSMSERGDA